MPKTIDNDLLLTDNCPGFWSVAKYVAISPREAAMDVASMCETSTKVFILKSWAATRLDCRGGGTGRRERRDAPHIILFPEIAFDREKFRPV